MGSRQKHGKTKQPQVTVIVQPPAAPQEKTPELKLDPLELFKFLLFAVRNAGKVSKTTWMGFGLLVVVLMAVGLKAIYPQAIDAQVHRLGRLLGLAEPKPLLGEWSDEKGVLDPLWVSGKSPSRYDPTSFFRSFYAGTTMLNIQDPTAGEELWNFDISFQFVVDPGQKAVAWILRADEKRKNYYLFKYHLPTGGNDESAKGSDVFEAFVVKNGIGSSARTVCADSLYGPVIPVGYRVNVEVEARNGTIRHAFTLSNYGSNPIIHPDKGKQRRTSCVFQGNPDRYGDFGFIVDEGEPPLRVNSYSFELAGISSVGTSDDKK